MVEENQSPEIKAEEKGKDIRRGLGLQNPEGLEFNSVSDVESLERYGGQGINGHFSLKFNEVVIYKDEITNNVGNTGAHEIEHKEQAERFTSVDIDNSYWKVLRESSLATRTGRNPENVHENHNEGDLIGLLPKLGYSTGVIASWIKDKPEVRSELQSFEEVLDSTDSWNSEMISITEAAQNYDIDGFPDPEDVNPEYSDETLGGLLDAHRYLQEQKAEDEVLRFSDPRLRAEMEGFAHFLSGVIKERHSREQRQLDIEAGLYDDHEDAPEKAKYTIRDKANSVKRAESYNQVIPNEGITVGEKAGDRLEELADIKQNLEKHGDMSEEEAVYYIMEEVQERKFDYAISELPEYKTFQDVEERLEAVQ